MNAEQSMNTNTVTPPLFDWSKHKLSIDASLIGIMVVHWKIPGTLNFFVCWTVIPGHTVVTGDLGTWVFEREFRPGPRHYSVPYMLEKLAPHTKYTVWSNDTLCEELDTLLRDNADLTAEEVEYLEDLRYYDSEYAYSYHAHCDPPGRFAEDIDNIPRGTRLHPQLQLVLEAFGEMCRRTEAEVQHAGDPA